MKSVIAIREPKQQLSDEVRKALLDQHPTGFGYAVPHGGNTVLYECYAGDSTNLAETLALVEETHKDDRVYYHFVHAEENEINWDSLQPFVMLDDGVDGEDSKNLLVLMVEGELPNYEGKNGKDEAGDDETFTPEYYFASTFIAPMIQELWDLANKDISRLMELISKKSQEDKIMAELGPRAAVFFIPCTGSAKAYATPTVKSFVKPDVIYMTRTLGLSTEAAAAPAPTKRKGMVQVASTTPITSPKKEEELPEGGTPDKDYTELLKNRAFVLANGDLWAKPLPGDMKVAKHWWTLNLPLPIPKDARLLYAGRPASELTPNAPLRKMMENVLKPKKAVSEQGPAEPPERIVEEPKKETPMTLFIPTDQKVAFKSLKDAGRFVCSSVEELEATMADYPTASVQLGVPFAELLMYSTDSFNRLNGHIKTAIFNETRCQLLGLEAKPSADGKVVQPIAAGANPNAAKPKVGMEEASRVRKSMTAK